MFERTWEGNSEDGVCSKGGYYQELMVLLYVTTSEFTIISMPREHLYTLIHTGVAEQVQQIWLSPDQCFD